MDDWKKFNETSLSGKEDFYSHLNMEDIKKKKKNLGEYHDLYVQSITLLLEDVFENFQNMCLEIYELEPAKFLFSFWISMASSFKND